MGVEVGVELKQHHIGLPVLLLALQQRRVVSLQRHVLLLQRPVVCLQLLPLGICLMQQCRPFRCSQAREMGAGRVKVKSECMT